MESTGVYWKPVWNILEANFTILLVNAQHVKSGSRTEDGCEGLPMDCRLVARRIVER
jgi:hypothetical protein